MKSPNALSLAQLSKIASASPKTFVLSPQFWWSNKRFVALGIISVVAIYYLSPFTHQGDQGRWVLLTWGIHFLALWGFSLTAFALAKAEVDTAIVYYVKKRGDEYLEGISADQYLVVELENLEARLIPHNESNPTPSAKRLFHNIFAEAKDRRYESSISLMQPYREEALEDIFRLHTLQKIALWIGILGTFVGLLLAIQESGLRNFQPEQGEDFIQVIGKMFDGLLVSFSASVAGLEAAVILGFCLLLLRKKHEIYFQGLERAVVMALSAARNSINKDAFLSDLRDATDELRKVRESFSTQLTDVRIVLGHLQEQLLKQSQLIDVGLKNLIETGVNFESFRRELREKQDNVIEEIAKSVDAVSLRATLQESISKAGNTLSEAVTPKITQVSMHLASFNESVIALKNTLDGNKTSITHSLSKLESQVKDSLSRNTDTVRDVSTRMNNISMKIDGIGPPRSGFPSSAQPQKLSIRKFISRLRW